MILLDNSDFPWQHPSFGILYKPEREGGGHCLLQDNYPVPNYRPQFSRLSFSQFSPTASYFRGFQTISHDHILFQSKIIHKIDSDSSTNHSM